MESRKKLAKAWGKEERITVRRENISVLQNANGVGTKYT